MHNNILFTVFDRLNYTEEINCFLRGVILRNGILLLIGEDNRVNLKTQIIFTVKMVKFHCNQGQKAKPQRLKSS